MSVYAFMLWCNPAGDEHDVIITDYIGPLGLDQNDIIPHHYCKIRVLYTFGSEPLG